MQKTIIICGLADIQNCVDKYNPDKMLTIINQNFSPDTPKGMDENRHLKMLIDDISEPREGFILPQKHHAQALLDFTNDWDTTCLLYTSPSPRDISGSRMPSSA